MEKICKKFVTHKINLDNCIGGRKKFFITKLCSGRFCLADSFIGWTDASKTLFTFIEVNIARWPFVKFSLDFSEHLQSWDKIQLPPKNMPFVVAAQYKFVQHLADTCDTLIKGCDLF